MKKFLLLALLIYSQLISAAIKIDVDLLRSSDHTKVWTPPSATTTLVGTNTTDDLSNKTLDKVNVTTEQVNAAATGANATLAAATSTMYKVSNAGLTSVDGITAPTSNLVITLQNKVGSAITLNNATGTAANQIITGTGANLSLADDASVIMQYSTTYSKWYVVGGSGSGGGGSISDWVTATAYVVGNYVNESNKIYKCISAHTSGTFATDLAASSWVEVSGPYNLTGPITSVGAATSVASQTGTGSTFVMNTSPTLVTPVLGVATATSLAASGNVTGANLSGTNTGDLLSQGQLEGSSVTTNTLKAPYNQLTTISTGIRLLQTGNENMLVNPNFEGQNTSGVASGWTNSAGTATITTTASEYSSGLQAQKIALSAQTLNFSQSVNTNTGIQKQGVVGILYKVPSAVSTFQVCSLVDAAEQTCVPTANLVLDDTYRWIEIPITFGSTSAGIKVKTTGNVTGNVFFDAAYVKQGIGLQNLMTDYMYSAKISNTGVVSDENKDWINGNCSVVSTSQYPCVFNTGIFTVAPTCVVSVNQGSTLVMAFNSPATTSGFTLRGFLSTTGADTAGATTVYCMKTGNDYLSSSANAYTASSANYPRTAYTPTFTGFGTVTSPDCYHSRDGEFLEVDCKFTTGTTTATEARISLPNSLVSSASGALRVAGEYIYDTASTSHGGAILIEASVGYITFSRPEVYSGASVAALAKSNGNNITSSGTILSVKFRVPIAGWTNSNVIVGSFQDVPVYEGALRPKIYTFDVSSSGTVSNEVGDLVNGNCSLASNDFTCTFNSGKFTTAAQCFANADRADESAWATTGSTTSTGTIVSTYNSPGGLASRAFHAFCIGY